MIDEFIQLKATLNEKIELLKKQLKEVRNEEKNYNYKRELIDIKDDVIGNKRKKEILSYYPSIDFKQLDKLNDFIQKIDDYDIDLINPFEFRVFINEIDSQYSQKIIDDFRALRRLDNELMLDDNYSDIMYNLVEELNEIYKIMLDEIRKKLLDEFEKEYDGVDFSKKIDDIYKEIDEIKKYDIFDESGNIVRYFENEEQLDEFYNWMISNIDINLQLKIIPVLTKELLTKIRKDKEISKEQEIEQNRQLLLQEVQEEIDVDNIDLSSFSDEERIIIEKGLEIYKKLRNEITSRTDLIEEYDKLPIDEKKDIYLLSNRYNWDIILCDIEKNILPKIDDDKENTINTFTLLNTLYENREKNYKNRKKLLSLLLDQIDLYEELIRFGTKYDTSQYDYVIRENIQEKDERYPKEINRKQIEMSYYLNHNVRMEFDKLKELRDRIEEKINEVDLKVIDGIDIDILKENFDSVYQEASNLIDEFKMILKEEYERRGIEVPNEISGKPKNLVFCLFDLDEDNIKTYKKSYKMVKKDLSEVKASEIGEPKVKILYEDVVKYKEYDIPHVTVQRIRLLNDKRVGFVKFNASKIIMDLIRERYGLDEDFEIYGIIGAVTKISKNEEYKPIIDKINKNMQYLIKIGEMFYDKDTNLEELFQLIDNGINRMNSITTEEVKKYE